MAHGAHVLVIDDDRPSLCLSERTLLHHGYRVSSRDWPELNPAQVAALAVDVLVLDLRFGSRPLGLDYLAELKAAPETARLPIVICSADVFAVREFDRRLAEFACQVVLKPYRPGDLARAVACGLTRNDERPTAPRSYAA